MLLHCCCGCLPHFVLLPLHPILPWDLQPPEARQSQPLCAGSFPLPPRAALPCTVCRSWGLVSPHGLHPRQLDQAEEAPVGTGRAWWGTDYCALWCLLNAAAATVPPPSRKLLTRPGGGEGQHFTCPSTAARLGSGLGTLQSLGRACSAAAGLGHCVWDGRGQTAATSPLCIQTAPGELGTKGCARLCFDSGRVRLCSSVSWRVRGAVCIDCLDSCLQNHAALRHPGDALPFKDHKWLAT